MARAKSLGEPESGTRKRLLFSGVLLFLSSAFALVLVEVGLALIHPRADQYLALTPNMRAVFQPKYQHGIEGPSVFQVNSMGVRAREWSEVRSSEYRILAMGGSTTEGLLNDQSRVWTSLLEEALGTGADGRPLWVGNIGRAGLSSRHHVLQAERLLETYDPDLLLVLVGVNDLSSRLKASDRYDPDFMHVRDNWHELEPMAFQVVPDQAGAMSWEDDTWFKRTNVWRVLRTIKYGYFSASLVQDAEGRFTYDWRENRLSGTLTDRLPDLDRALDEYDENLNRIVDNALARGVAPILMTQPTVWREEMSEEEKRLLWMGGVGNFQSEPRSQYYTPRALAAAMGLYNERLLGVCQARDISCFDIAAAVPKTMDNFYDDCHLTDQGNRIVAREIARLLQAEWAADGDPDRAVVSAP